MDGAANRRLHSFSTFLRRAREDASSCSPRMALTGFHRSLWTLPPGPFPTLSCISIVLLIISWGVESGAEGALVDAAAEIARTLQHADSAPDLSAVAAAKTTLYVLLFLIFIVAVLRGVYARQVYVASGQRWQHELQEACKRQSGTGEHHSGLGAAPSDDAIGRGEGMTPGDDAISPRSELGRRIVARGTQATRSVLCSTAKAGAGCLWVLFSVVPCLGVLLALIVLLLAAAVLGALLGAEAGCGWVLPTLDSDGANLMFTVATSNETSLATALSYGLVAAGVPVDLDAVGVAASLGSEEAIFQSAVTAQQLRLALAMTTSIVPSANATMRALEPACDFALALDTADITSLCVRLEAVVDLFIDTINGPPLHANLDVNASALLRAVCGPVTIVTAQGLSMCTHLPLLTAALARAHTVEAMSTTVAESTGDGVQGLRQVLQSRLAVAQVFAPLLESVEGLVGHLRQALGGAILTAATAAAGGGGRPRDIRADIRAICHELDGLEEHGYRLVHAAGFALAATLVMRYCSLRYERFLRCAPPSAMAPAPHMRRSPTCFVPSPPSLLPACACAALRMLSGPHPLDSAD